MEFKYLKHWEVHKLSYKFIKHCWRKWSVKKSNFKSSETQIPEPQALSFNTFSQFCRHQVVLILNPSTSVLFLFGVREEGEREDFGEVQWSLPPTSLFDVRRQIFTLDDIENVDSQTVGVMIVFSFFSSFLLSLHSTIHPATCPRNTDWDSTSS